MLRFTGQYIFFIDLFLSLIEVNAYFFNTNTGQCIYFLILIQVNVYFYWPFLSLIQVNEYFLVTFFIINLTLVLKKIYIDLY